MIIKGKKANPIKIVERLRKKSNKHVDLIFPRNPKIEEKKEEKKKEVDLFIFKHHWQWIFIFRTFETN